MESKTTPVITHVNSTGCQVQSPSNPNDLDQLLIAVATNPHAQRALVMLANKTPVEMKGSRTPTFAGEETQRPAVEITTPEEKPTFQSIVDDMKKANGPVEEKEAGSSEVIDGSPTSEVLEAARASASEKKLTPVEEEDIDDTDGELEGHNLTSNTDGEVTAR